MPSEDNRVRRTRPRRLEIHVINGGYGESIIVRLPNGRWGVVDCYAPTPDDPATNPTIDFLKRKRVRNLEFVCLTHPHDDHFRGMSQVFNCFQVRRFWRFPLTYEDLVNLVCLQRISVEETNDASRHEAINDLQKTLALTGELMEKNPTFRISTPEVNTVLYPWPVRGNGAVEVEIRAIAPVGGAVQRFHRALRRCFTREGTLSDDAPSLKCNELSIALLIRYGGVRVILGGDVERSNWESVLEAVDRRDLRSRAVKVSHHGSRTGYCDGLWPVLSGRRTRPVAVVAPSLKHRLPDRDAIEHIQEYVQALYVTCPGAITFEARYEFPDRYVAEKQDAIRSEMSSFLPVREQPGVCSICFDSADSPPQVILRNGAKQMSVS